MTPSTAASALEELAADLPLLKEDRLALDLSLKSAKSRLTSDGLVEVDDLAHKLADKFGTKFPRFGREVMALRVKILRAMGELRKERSA